MGNIITFKIRPRSWTDDPYTTGEAVKHLQLITDRPPTVIFETEECLICFDKLINNKVVLTCGHIICLDCLIKTKVLTVDESTANMYTDADEHECPYRCKIELETSYFIQ